MTVEEQRANSDGVADNQAQGQDFSHVVNMLFNMAMQGDPRTEDLVNDILSRLPQEVKESDDGKKVIEAFDFFVALSQAEDKGMYFEAHVPDDLRALLADLARQAQSEYDDLLVGLLQASLAGDQKVEETVQRLLNEIPEDAKSTEQVKDLISMFNFFIDLSKADNKEQFAKDNAPGKLQAFLKELL